MASAIARKLTGQNPLLICVMNGGVVLYGKLLGRLNFPLQCDYIHATRYREQLAGSELHWIAGPHADPAGRTVVLVDDILDEGMTLEALVRYYHERGAAAVYSAVLTVKDRNRSTDIKADFTGLTVPDRYVFGYGMDYKGYLRNAPGIYAEKGS
jgi:hypoxanthine phosphoribosyltransferase